MHKVKVLFFATLRDYVGTKSVELEIPFGSTVGGLTDMLVATYPRLEKVKDFNDGSHQPRIRCRRASHPSRG